MEIDTEYLPNCEQENLPSDEPIFLLGIDFETTGVSVENDKIIETGLVLFDWKRKLPCVCLSYLVNWPNLEIPQDITKLTGITKKDLEDFGFSPKGVFEDIFELMQKAKYIVAYNGNNFDRPLLINNAKEFNYSFDRHWLDLMIDIDYPEHIDTKKLEFLAAQHGFLNPFSHRAVFDVLTMFKIMAQYDLDKIVASAQVSMIEIRACVSFADKDKAKLLKYYWDGERKIWVKKIKENKYQLEEEKVKTLGFQIVRLGI
jgi:DNA polymerase III subunit epsilon